MNSGEISSASRKQWKYQEFLSNPNSEISFIAAIGRSVYAPISFNLCSWSLFWYGSKENISSISSRGGENELLFKFNRFPHRLGLAATFLSSSSTSSTEWLLEWIVTILSLATDVSSSSLDSSSFFLDLPSFLILDVGEAFGFLGCSLPLILDWLPLPDSEGLSVPLSKAAPVLLFPCGEGPVMVLFSSFFFFLS